MSETADNIPTVTTPLADQPTAATQPSATQPSDPQPQPTQAMPAEQAAPAPQRRSARFGTILWGVLLLTFAAAIVTNAVTNIAIDPVAWIITALIGVGAILIVAGIAAAIRR